MSDFKKKKKLTNFHSCSICKGKLLKKKNANYVLKSNLYRVQICQICTKLHVAQ